MRSLEGLLDGTGDGRSRRRHAAVDLEDVDVSLLRPFTLGIQATALAQLNRPGEARHTLDRVDEHWRSETKARLMAELAESWMLGDVGTQPGGRPPCCHALGGADAQHAPLAMFAAHDAVRFGHAQWRCPC